MKKKIVASTLAFVACCSACAGFVGCGGTGATNNGSTISAKPLTVAQLGDGYQAKYLPDTSSIRQLSGKIDVCLDFEGTQGGWMALAEEYQRLQGNAVIVKIDATNAGTNYSSRLNNELQNLNTDWDIVEGNLGYGNTYTHCIDMRPVLSSPNPYCGENVIWSSVLDSAAWKTKEADNEGVSYILNSEIMQTCWFINDVAFDAAVEQGYVNADYEAAYPITWDDLIYLCECMEAAGYTNPLGITLCNSSVESLQFSWLLRVYGDYYYRQFYKYIMVGNTDQTWDNYDPSATVVELNDGYKVKYAKLLNILMEKETTIGSGYVGYTSEVYLDFVSQLNKMKGHLMQNVSTTEFSDLRDKFSTQSNGKNSPQIMLDYQGFGLNYAGAKDDDFEVGYFDYPKMISGTYQSGDHEGEPIVDPSTITRDIGGNGGFLSIVNHPGNSAQNDLNKDFIKFVMSPYGQTIYYQGLAKSNSVPKGLSSVKNDLIVIPTAWKSYFEESNKTIKFNGDVDACNFLSWGVRYVTGLPATQAVITEYWQNLLMTGLPAAQALTVEAFAAKWDTAVRKDIVTACINNKWPVDDAKKTYFWQDPNKSDL